MKLISVSRDHGQSKICPVCGDQIKKGEMFRFIIPMETQSITFDLCRDCAYGLYKKIDAVFEAGIPHGEVLTEDSATQEKGYY